MDGFLDSIRGHINERLNSPMVGAYVLSWLFVNYRLPLIAFSDLDISERVAKIDYLMHGTIPNFAFCYGLPLTISAFYIFALPYPARWILKFTLRQQEEAKKIKQEIIKQSLVSVETLHELETKWRDERESLESKLNGSESRNTYLREQRAQAENEAKEWQEIARSAQQAEKDVVELTRKLEHAIGERDVRDRQIINTVTELESLKSTVAATDSHLAAMRQMLEALYESVEVTQGGDAALIAVERMLETENAVPGWVEAWARGKISNAKSRTVRFDLSPRIPNARINPLPGLEGLKPLLQPLAPVINPTKPGK